MRGLPCIPKEILPCPEILWFAAFALTLPQALPTAAAAAVFPGVLNGSHYGGGGGA
jgi:hypothetical protein